MNFINKESKFKKKYFRRGGLWGGGVGIEGGASVSNFFVTKNPNLK